MSAKRNGQPLSFSIPFGRSIVITSLQTYPNHLEISYLIDGRVTSLARIQYPHHVLTELSKHYAPSELRSIHCHIALFEGMKYCLTFPEYYDVTLIADGLSDAAISLFSVIATHAWAQHHYENNVRHYTGPEIVSNTPINKQTQPIITKNSGGLLCANGGGKDSFLVMKILEKANIPYAMFQHARSEYGRHDMQHNLQRRILPHLPHTQREHLISVWDDFTNAKMVALHNPSLTGECMKGNPCQVGWPEMIFEALPFVLLHGYQGFVLGNERSADAVQATWEQPVNHQWIKSNEACMLLNDFIQHCMIKNFKVFSLLKPIHDQRIYQNLKAYPDVLAAFHSCNISKPWCKKCAKCAYVWLNLVAVFGEEVLHPIFQKNLFDDPDLAVYWQELLGLSTHNAFECVGETEETQLAFYRCVQSGCKGQAIKLFCDTILKHHPEASYWNTIATKYNKVHQDGHLIPEEVFSIVKTWL